MLCLQNFARADGIGGHRDCPANLRGREAGRQRQRVGEQAISKQHGDVIAPVGRQRQPAPANLGFIHHVVMHQRRQVHHLDDYGHRHVGVADLAQGLGGQGHQRGSQMLALPVQRIISVRDESGSKASTCLARRCLTASRNGSTGSTICFQVQAGWAFDASGAEEKPLWNQPQTCAPSLRLHLSESNLLSPTLCAGPNRTNPKATRQVHLPCNLTQPAADACIKIGNGKGRPGRISRSGKQEAPPCSQALVS